MRSKFIGVTKNLGPPQLEDSYPEAQKYRNVVISGRWLLMTVVPVSWAQTVWHKWHLSVAFLGGMFRRDV
jgi:hypothetical protein